MKKNFRFLLSPLTFCMLLGVALPARANANLTHLSGPVTVKKLDGTTVPGFQGATVLTGEIVTTGEKGYVRMEMSDGGEMVLRPDSQLKIETYNFDKANPKDDNLIISMFKGGLRKITGLIGKRGNQDAYKMVTPTATIGIRGTQFDLRICQANCGALGDGTYVAVRFGAIQTGNEQGSMTVPAGQVVHVPAQRPPVILPRDPGIGFTPPAVIPKLDEKKKREQQQQQAAAEQPKPSAAEQQKPADKSTTDAKKPVENKPADQPGKEEKPVSGVVSSGEGAKTQNSQTTPPQASSGSGQGSNPVQCSVE